MILAVFCIWRHAPSLAAERAANQPASLRAAWGSSGVTLSGTVSQPEHGLILGAARKAFGADRVAADELRAAPRRAAPLDLADLIATAPRGLGEGVLEVNGKSLKLSGTVASEEARAEILQTLRAVAGASLPLVDDLVVAGSSVPSFSVTATPSAESPAKPAPLPSPSPRRPAPTDLQAAIEGVLADRPIEFALGSATLTARSRRTLDQLLPLLKRNPRARIQVRSHTDAWGGTAHNRLLSQKRADAVVAHFVRKGLDRRRFTAVGYGETRPIAKGRTAADMARNRRTEIRVKKGR